MSVSTYMDLECESVPVIMYILLEDCEPQAIDRVLEHLLAVVNGAVQESTPWARPSSWARHKWTKEYSEAIRTARACRRDVINFRARYKGTLEQEELAGELREEEKTSWLYLTALEPAIRLCTL